MVPISHIMILSGVLFALGVVCVAARRNLLMILIGVEVMINAAGLAFVAGSLRWGQPDGQVMFFFMLTLAAAEVSVGLALVLAAYHHFKTLDLDALSTMKG